MSHLKRLLLQEIFVGEIAGPYETEAISLDDSQGFCIVNQATAVVISPFTFLSSDVTLSTIHKVAHGCESGLAVKFSTSGVLPTGLNSTDVFYLVSAANDYLMVSSTQNGLNLVTFSGGSGTHTITAEAATPIYMRLQASIDGILWADVPGSQREITSTVKMVEHESAFYHYLKISLEVASGQYSLNSKIMVRGGPF